jgi:hypothetical protein
VINVTLSARPVPLSSLTIPLRSTIAGMTFV